MKFNELLEVYEYWVDTYVSKQERTNESCTKQIEGIFSMFEMLKLSCDDYNEIINPRPVNEEEHEEFKLVEENGEPLEVSNIIEYRGGKIPLYFDDYGQQVFVVINNKEYGMGGYNHCLDDVGYLYDKFLLDKIIKKE